MPDFKTIMIRIRLIWRVRRLHQFLPNIRQNLPHGVLVLKLFLAAGAALIQDSLDMTLRDPEEAGRFLRTDVIGTLPLDPNVSQLPKVAEPESTSIAPTLTAVNGNGHQRNGYYRSISGFEEAVRMIRNTIFIGDFEQQLRSIVLTSAEPGEGKTTLAAHLAISNAARGKTTLLVDGDLRRPGLHARFGLTPREGLSNVLTGELPWQDVVVPIDGRPNLHLLPSGPGSHRAADLVGHKLFSLLDEFAKEYDLVILDSPPLLGFAECLQMATAADGVVVISRAGQTKRKAVASVITTLKRLRANVIGVVLNQVARSEHIGRRLFLLWPLSLRSHYKKAEQWSSSRALGARNIRYGFWDRVDSS